ncbi:MAG: hypothetical protein AB1664_12440 [Thermodesulfobacteriota bacterium]
MSSRNTCFGIFKFDKDHFDLFEKVVFPLIETHTGLKGVCADDYYEPKLTKMNTIVRMIEEARLVVVEISQKSDNPNVFIELGIAYYLRKPLILLCNDLNFCKIWNKTPPFDMQGRELVIYKNEDDLRVRIGACIFDALYRPEAQVLGWSSSNVTERGRTSPRNQSQSPREITLMEEGEVWSDKAVHSNFTIRFRAAIEKKPQTDHPNPDFRMHVAPSPGGYPRITVILPWEVEEKGDSKHYQCHIDHFVNSGDELDEQNRLRQVAVLKKDRPSKVHYEVFITCSYPHFVVESTFFVEEHPRLYVPISDFIARHHPFHLDQYIGFASPNSNVKLSDIEIKEIHAP